MRLKPTDSPSKICTNNLAPDGQFMIAFIAACSFNQRAICMFPIYDANPTKVFPIATTSLILLTILVWLLVQGAGNENVLDYSLCRYASSQNYHLDQGIIHRQWCENDNIGSFSLITSVFIHGDWFHLIFNLWFLWIFGNNIEEAFGRTKFLAIFLFAGVFTEVASIMTSNEKFSLSFGASGAVAAILGAYLVIFKHAKVLVFIPFAWSLKFRKTPKNVAHDGKKDMRSGIYYWPAMYFIFLYIALDLQTLFEDMIDDNSGVNVVAHLSGYFLGAAVAYAGMKMQMFSHLNETIQFQEHQKTQSKDIDPIILTIVGGLQIVVSWLFVFATLALLLFIASLFYR